MVASLLRPRIPSLLLFGIALTSLLAGSAVSEVSGQLDPGTPLPSGLVFEWDSESDFPLETFYLSEPTVSSLLTAAVSFDTATKRVWIEGAYQKRDPITSEGLQAGWHATSFQPTAIAVAAPLSRKFFVAGYQQRTGKVLIEHWRFEGVGPGSYAAVPPPGSPPGSQPVTHLTLTFSIRRELVMESAELGPIHDLVYLVDTDELMFLAGATSRSLYRCDVTSGAVVEAGEASTVTALGEYTSLELLLPQAPHNIGGAAVVVLNRARAWEQWRSSGEDVHVLLDQDRDGIFELSASLPTETFKSGEWFEHTAEYYKDDGTIVHPQETQ